MKLKNIIGDNLGDRVCFGFLASTIIASGALAYYLIDRIPKELEYLELVNPICERAIKTADRNKNGYLEPEECVRLTRELGIREVIPTASIITQMKPGDFRKKTVCLRVSCAGSDINGMASGEPIYDRHYEVKLSDVERFIQNKSDNEENRK